jgi:hypothetical protein
MAKIPKGYRAVLASFPYVLAAETSGAITRATLLRQWDVITGRFTDAEPATADMWVKWMPYARPYAGDGSDVTP